MPDQIARIRALICIQSCKRAKQSHPRESNRRLRAFAPRAAADKMRRVGKGAKRRAHHLSPIALLDGGHASAFALRATARQVRFAHPTDCELICFTRKRNLGAQLRQTGTTGKSPKTCPALRVKIFCFRSHANHRHNSARLTQLRGARHRHERAVRCDGRESCD